MSRRENGEHILRRTDGIYMKRRNTKPIEVQLMKTQTGNGSKNIQRGRRLLREECLNCTEYEKKLRELMSDLQRRKIDYLSLSSQLTALLRKFDKLECSLQQKRDSPTYLGANQNSHVRMNKKSLQKTAASAEFEFQKDKKIVQQRA